MSPVGEYDVLVAGGRVAGSSLAIRLAEQGRKVLVVDRDSFPSDTISTHGLGFTAVESLRRLGVLERIEAAGFQRMYRHRAWVEDVFIEAPAGPPGAYTLAPRRAVLDQVLRERAAECGAEVIERARVDELVFEGGAVAGAVVQKLGGEKLTVRARVVVGADGKTSLVAKAVEAERYGDHGLGRPVYYGYFHSVQALPEPTVEMFFTSNRVGFCMAMRPDEHILIVEAQPEDFERIRRDPQAWLMGELGALPGMASRLSNAVLDGRVLGSRGVDNHFRKPYGPGWALTGDAGYVKDPITAYGVGDALIQGFWLARSLGAWLDGADWEATMSEFQQRRDLLLTPLFEQTTAAMAARDSDDDFDAVRAALVSQHDARRLLRALPRLFDQVFDPMDQVRHAAIRSMFEAARQRDSVEVRR